MPRSRVTLVTGLPSFRAARLAAHLLEQNEDEVWSVVAPARYKLAERFRDERSPAERGRLRLFSGDPAAIDMGLAGAEYTELVRSVECVQHLEQAASESRELCEAINIGAMREV